MGVEPAQMIGTRSADYIRASGHETAQTGRTHDLHPTASRTSDSSCNAGVVHTRPIAEVARVNVAEILGSQAVRLLRCPTGALRKLDGCNCSIVGGRSNLGSA